MQRYRSDHRRRPRYRRRHRKARRGARLRRRDQLQEQCRSRGGGRRDDRRRTAARRVAIQGDMAMEADIERMFEAVDALRAAARISSITAASPARIRGSRRCRRRRCARCSTSTCWAHAVRARRDPAHVDEARRAGRRDACCCRRCSRDRRRRANMSGTPPSKGAVDSHDVPGCRKELAGEGIRVNCGVARADRHRDPRSPAGSRGSRRMLPMGRVGTAGGESPRRSCSCCRMRRPTPAARSCASPARASA